LRLRVALSYPGEFQRRFSWFNLLPITGLSCGRTSQGFSEELSCQSDEEFSLNGTYVALLHDKLNFFCFKRWQIKCIHIDVRRVVASEGKVMKKASFIHAHFCTRIRFKKSTVRHCPESCFKILHVLSRTYLLLSTPGQIVRVQYNYCSPRTVYIYCVQILYSSRECRFKSQRYLDASYNTQVQALEY
jgi:hypothetical protein